MDRDVSAGGQDVEDSQEAAARVSKKASKRNAPASPRQPRKRTKTGCLTCRKRRIKCGEERPTCQNCQKSRRDCEGYRPPIVFRRSHLHSGPPGVSLAPQADLTNPYFNSLASQFGLFEQDVSSVWPSTTWRSTAAVPAVSDSFSLVVPQLSHPTIPSLNAELPLEAYSGAGYAQPSAHFFTQDLWQLPVGEDLNKPSLAPQSQSSLDQTPGVTPISQDETLSLFHEAVSDPSLYGQEQHRLVKENNYDLSQTSQTDYSSASLEANSSQAIPSLLPAHYPLISHQIANATVDGAYVGSLPANGFESVANVQSADQASPLLPYQEKCFVPSLGHLVSSQFLDAAAVVIQDDDYWDVQSDLDEDDIHEKSPRLDVASSDSGLDNITSLVKRSMALAISNLTDANAYTYPGFSLDSYRPERTANPLRNPYTQRVFAHFIFSTGPLISYLQQRNRVLLSHKSGTGSFSSSQQGLWTYTLATMALHNQGLLHAMLAMASLHMAKLQGASVTPSLKHYSYSLRRVHRDVQHNRKRHEVPTLAATLLLAFYEIMQADHRKWSTHLVGAKQLISEVDFAGMTAQIEYQKAKCAMSSSGLHKAASEGEAIGQKIEELFPTCDSHLLGKLMGKQCAHDDKDRLMQDWPQVDDKKDLSPSDLHNFQILQDLFWWNTRHDVIHALVGGNSLLLNYEKWKDCLPRSPAGQPDAVHGSFDHFMLLMGRLLSFITEDRTRKLRASKAKQSAIDQSIQASGQVLGSAAALPAMPTGPGFYGMAPSFGPSPLPRAFERYGNQPTSTDTADMSSSPTSAATELETATALAMHEWADIMSAFNAFADSLGPAFQPLTDEEHSPIMTPFGAAVLFKSHEIAALWAWYYAGLIVALRSHPKMPAPATMAIGVAARDTAKYANQVGRIVYCITGDFLTPPLDPSSAGAFSEASLPIFLAGVQFQDPEQRRWTIGRLREIESLTGWATIGLCAKGCESAWIKAHGMGRGPEYVRSTGIEKGEGSLCVSRDMQEESGPLPSAAESSTRGTSSSKLQNTENESSSSHTKQVEAEGKFSPFYRGTQVMWAYQLFNTSLEEDLADKPHGRDYNLDAPTSFSAAPAKVSGNVY